MQPPPPSVCGHWLNAAACSHVCYSWGDETADALNLNLYCSARLLRRDRSRKRVELQFKFSLHAGSFVSA